MNIVLAPDSFKGSLTATQVSQIMKTAIGDSEGIFNIIQKPMADGGEGILEALLSSNSGTEIPVCCSDALGNKIKTSYGIINESTAVIETAKIIGLPGVPYHKRNIDNTTTFGIGEVIIDALDNGCTSFIIGLGGSATNEGGLGMFQALGVKFYDKLGVEIGSYGKDLLNFHDVDFNLLDPRLKKVSLKVASDVNNQLYGRSGATFVYGPQKGIMKEKSQKYDDAMKYFSEILDKNNSIFKLHGSGAAGGLGFAFLLLGAQLFKGAKLVAESIQLETTIKKADLIITGEGMTDQQTLKFGKTADFVRELAEKYNIPILLISGSLQGDMNALREYFDGCFSIITSPLSLEECIIDSEKLLYEQTKNVIHFMKTIKNIKI